jgi:hypothetical protein
MTIRRLELNKTQQFLIYADDVNAFGKINTINKNRETTLDPRKEAGIEINTKKTQHIMCHHTDT